jgi:hypothetical protein
VASNFQEHRLTQVCHVPSAHLCHSAQH